MHALKLETTKSNTKWLGTKNELKWTTKCEIKIYEPRFTQNNEKTINNYLSIGFLDFIQNAKLKTEMYSGPFN